jgi:HK97 family phage prohead protease
MELRYTVDGETMLEERGDGTSYLSGYASVWYDGTSGTEYHLGGNRYERIDPRAFDKVIQEKQNVEARFNHSQDFILGDVATGTLELRSDKRGLHYRVPFDAQDPDMLKVRSKIKKGLIKGSSFGFIPAKIEWRSEGDKHVGTVREVLVLRDVGPVNNGAYKGTTAEYRSEAIERSYDEWLNNEKMKSETEARLKKLPFLLEK